MSARVMQRARERHVREEKRRSARLAARVGVGTGTALGATALLAPAAQAGTFVVSDLGDSGPDTLREAVDDANSNPGADVVTFEAGLSGEIVLTTGQIPIEEALEIQGPGADVITVSGDDASRIFYVKPTIAGDAGDPVTISGLTLTEGTTDGSPGDNGGAVHAFYTELMLTEVVVTDSYAENFGGGVELESSSINVLSSAMTGNYAGGSNGDGGAIYRNNNPYGPEVIADSVFTDNHGTANGGAITLYDSYYSPITIENTTIAGNAGDGSGGGIQIWDADEDAPITIRNSTISGNETDGEGGGISVALFAGQDGNASIAIENTTVSGNQAESRGGGVHLYGNYPSSVRISNSTIVGNAADDGGGVFLYHEETPTTLSSTIVAGNSADDEGDELFASTDGGGVFEVGFSLIQGTTQGQITESPGGTNVLGQSPQLGALAANGGLTQTHLPAASSPAIDAGIANGLATDQRGEPRTFDSVAVANAAGSDGTDIGSVELQPGEGGLPEEAECKGVTVQKIEGTSADDTITGSDARELISGRAGNDTIRALGGKDCVNGNRGSDTLRGGGESDLIKGGRGRDKVKGGGDGDRAKGQGGRDRVSGGGGDDKVTGGGGKDRVKGGKGIDKLKGQGGKDRLKAADGKQDKVNCGGGKDRATVDPKDRVSRNCEKVIEVE